MARIESIVLVVLFLNTGSVSGDCSRCLECNEGTNRCAYCPPGLWGFNCDRMCSSDYCLNNTCEQFSGHCTYGCHDGRYPVAISRGMSCLPCPDNCVRCTKRDYCTECVPGRFGDLCQHYCDEGCGSCVEFWDGATSGKCLACSEGLMGFFCGYDCSFCKNGQCNRTDCTLGECMDGYHYYNDRVCVRCYSSCKTCNAFSYAEGKCYTCPTGRWGNLCDKECPAECVDRQCDQYTGTCLCDKGSYLDTDKSCKACPINCKECISGDDCTACKDGFYGTTCQSVCSPDCVACKSQSDKCVACAGGKYLRDHSCHQCDAGCTTCRWLKSSKTTECETCEQGYRLDRMEEHLVHKCFKCPDGCTKCNKNYECQGCYPGYYSFLQTCCPDHCIGCKSPTDCTRCKKGFHGATCSKRCQKNCKSCSTDSTCHECVDGRYGLVMEYNKNYCECSQTECSTFDAVGRCQGCRSAGWVPKGTGCCECNFCSDNICDGNGNCLSGCKSSKYHGMNCSMPCEKTIDHCTHCVDETDNVRCTQCRPYTTYLTNNTCKGCPMNCKSKICETDGSCSYGCWDGWTGPTCDMKCEERCIGHCNHTTCEACKPGFHGDVCLETCGEYCLTDSDGTPLCDKSGSCLECVEGYFGEACDKLCGYRCKSGLCERTTGRCLAGCVGHFYGKRCGTPCSPNCFSIACSEINGTCLYGCIEGYSGDRCDVMIGPTGDGRALGWNVYLAGVTLLILQIFLY